MSHPKEPISRDSTDVRFENRQIQSMLMEAGTEGASGGGGLLTGKVYKGASGGRKCFVS